MTMGQRIKRARERLCLTQPELAKRVGVSGQAVSEWEREKSQPEASRLAALRKALKVPALWLLEGDGSPPPEDDMAARIEALSPADRSEMERHLRMLEEDRARETPHERAS